MSDDDQNQRFHERKISPWLVLVILVGPSILMLPLSFFSFPRSSSCSARSCHGRLGRASLRFVLDLHANFAALTDVELAVNDPRDPLGDLFRILVLPDIAPDRHTCGSRGHRVAHHF